MDTERKGSLMLSLLFLSYAPVPLGCSSVGAECVEFCKLLWQTIKKKEGVIRVLNSELATQKHWGSN